MEKIKPCEPDISVNLRDVVNKKHFYTIMAEPWELRDTTL